MLKFCLRIRVLQLEHGGSNCHTHTHQNMVEIMARIVKKAKNDNPHAKVKIVPPIRAVIQYYS